MPKYAATHLPAPLRDAAAALGANPARVAVLHALTQHPNSTPAQLAEFAGMSVNTVRTHLGQLLDLGVICSDPDASLPFSERNGQRARYAVHVDQLVDVLETLADAFDAS